MSRPIRIRFENRVWNSYIFAIGLTGGVRSYEVLYKALTLSKEDLMERPEVATLACVNPECQQFRQSGQGDLVTLSVFKPVVPRPWRPETVGIELRRAQL